MHKNPDVEHRADETTQTTVLHHAAHELRNALANVQQSAELLADERLGTLSPPHREMVDTVHRNGIKLRVLTEFLLAYGAWRGRGGRPVRVRCAVRPLLNQCVRRYQPLAALHQCRVEVRCAELDVCLDSDGLYLAIDNIVANALKVSPPGATVIVAAQLESVAAVTQLVIDVTDEGPAIPKARRQALFDTLDQEPLEWQVEKPTVRGGLAIASDCVRAHGGTIEALERPHGGTQIRMRLPMPARPVAEHASAA